MRVNFTIDILDAGSMSLMYQSLINRLQSNNGVVWSRKYT